MTRWVIPAIGLMLLASSACNTAKRVRIAGPDELYARGTMAHEDENHESAIQEYRMFLDHYPLDPRAEEVEKRIADAYFENGLYPEAIATYGHFQSMHPTNADQALIEYRVGEAYRLQIDTIDRDVAAAQNAHEHYRNLALRFPNNPHAQKAREQLASTREHLAEREFYVAEFYADADKFRAATTRAGEIVIRFPDTSVTRKAIVLLAKLSKKENDTLLLQLSENALSEVTAHDEVADPKSPPQYAGPALQLLRLHLEQFKTMPTAPRSDS